MLIFPAFCLSEGLTSENYLTGDATDAYEIAMTYLSPTQAQSDATEDEYPGSSDNFFAIQHNIGELLALYEEMSQKVQSLKLLVAAQYMP